MLNFINKRHSSENYHKMPDLTHQMADTQKLDKIMGKRQTPRLLLYLQNYTVSKEGNLVKSYKTTYSFDLEIPFLGIYPEDNTQ